MSTQPHRPGRASRRRRRRRGAVLICMLACCLTALSLSISAVRLALRSARESKQCLRLRQTEWLLNAGVLRARQNLTDAEYLGEAWEIPATVTGTEAAVVKITVEPAAQTAQPRVSSVAITAEYGTSPNALRRSCTVNLAHPPAEPSTNSN